jgi:hypothetical protein
MRYIGVDPGAKFTGVAVLEVPSTFLYHAEFDDPTEVMLAIQRYAQPGDKVIVEAMLGGGGRDTYIVSTIEVVGYVYYSCIEIGIEVEKVPNQARLANVANVPKTITGKDEVSAAAHALSAEERERKRGTAHNRKAQRRNGPSTTTDPRKM